MTVFYVLRPAWSSTSRRQPLLPRFLCHRLGGRAAVDRAVDELDKLKVTGSSRVAHLQRHIGPNEVVDVAVLAFA